MHRTGLPVLLLGLLSFAPSARAQSAREKLARALTDIPEKELVRSAIGVTRTGTAIPSLLDQGDLDYNTPKTRLLLVGGLDGTPESVSATIACLRWFHSSPEARPLRERFTLSAVPCANPDAWAAGKGPANLSKGNPLVGYPPKGDAYSSPTDPEAAYLWRWIGMHAPDLVIVLLPGKEPAWAVPTGTKDTRLNALRKALHPEPSTPAAGRLAAELVRGEPSAVGPVPALEMFVPPGAAEKSLRSLLGTIEKTGFRGPSPARKEIQRRLDRKPVTVAQQLAHRYGRELKSVEYIGAMALVGRLRLGELTGGPAHRTDVEKIVAPYVTGKKAPLGPRTSGPALAGHLVFAELAAITKDPKYRDLVRRAADRAFDTRGKPLPAVPGHSEMSDSVFMACPILARAGRLTGERKYFDACARHLAFMRKLTARSDNLYRHSPLDEAAWGRGNGFPALGLALSLSDLPEDHPARPGMLKVFREHLEALLKHQDPTGAWHQVIDVPGSYRELTSTCMITFAMARGVRKGWLDREKYEPAIRRAWYAIRTRVRPDGSLVDVCTGTGKQQDLRAYFDRKAILGPDGRGGAMALLAAVEIAEWEATRK
jgi:unsaturated rhamnogalacturonyl hydrolase